MGPIAMEDGFLMEIQVAMKSVVAKFLGHTRLQKFLKVIVAPDTEVVDEEQMQRRMLN